MKRCVDCKHLTGDELITPQCMAAENQTVDYVYGGIIGRYSPDFCRKDKTLCGPDAAWFQAKHPLKVVA